MKNMDHIKKVKEVCILMDSNMFLIQCCKYRILVYLDPDNSSLLLASHTKRDIVAIWMRLFKQRPSLSAGIAK